MRFEKLNENKIKITLNYADLAKKDIDIHSFMSNSIETQDLFFDMLEEAKKEIGFDTKNYLIAIEALAMTGGEFVLTVTRSLPKNNSNASFSNSKSRKIHNRDKKVSNLDFRKVVYVFSNFEDYCLFLDYYKNSFKSFNFAKKIILYEYKGQYFLVINGFNIHFKGLKILIASITEFATCFNNFSIIESKLIENGNLIMKHNAVSFGVNYFV